MDFVVGIVGCRFGEGAKNSSDFHIKIARLGLELEIEFSQSWQKRAHSAFPGTGFQHIQWMPKRRLRSTGKGSRQGVNLNSSLK